MFHVVCVRHKLGYRPQHLWHTAPHIVAQIIILELRGLRKHPKCTEDNPVHRVLIGDLMVWCNSAHAAERRRKTNSGTVYSGCALFNIIANQEQK